MTFVWTRNSRFGGKEDIITFFLREPVSHFGILFNNDMVMHWNFEGFHVHSLHEFLEHREVIYSMDYEISKYREEKFYNNAQIKYVDSLYDYGYLLWLIWRAFLLLFGVRIPEKCTKLDSPSNMICNEALEAMPKDIKPEYDHCKANTPYRLYLELKKGRKDVVS